MRQIQKNSRSLIVVLLTMAAGWSLHANDPIKVFFLAGQSNMVGYGRVETGVGDVAGAIGSLRYEVNNDPDRYGHLVDHAGDWKVRDDVWVWSRQSEYVYQPPGSRDQFATGSLTAGFGHDAHAARTALGPELGFGTVLGDVYDGQVVLVKVAWGGATLAIDFRPPTAVADRGGSVGAYYNLMLDAFQDALVAIATRFRRRDIEITGFGWHQGWSDRINPSFNAEYEENLADFIVDVRNALGVADLPFIIAETGHGGVRETDPLALALMAAQEAMVDPGKYPEFAGNVGFVDTQRFWRDARVSPRDVNFHWNENGETYYLIGDAMGHAMKLLLQAEAAGANPRITSMQPVGDGVWELTLEGAADTRYEFRSSNSLDFEAAPRLANLVQGDPENNPGSVIDSTLLATDSAGIGTVRISLGSDPAGFVRAQVPTSPAAGN